MHHRSRQVFQAGSAGPNAAAGTPVRGAEPQNPHVMDGLSMYRRKAKYSTAHEVRHERYDKKLSPQVHVPETLPEREQEPEKQEAAPHGSRHDH